MGDTERYAKVTIIVDYGDRVSTRTFPKADKVIFEDGYDESVLLGNNAMRIALQFKALFDEAEGHVYKVENTVSGGGFYVN